MNATMYIVAKIFPLIIPFVSQAEEGIITNCGTINPNLLKCLRSFDTANALKHLLRRMQCMSSTNHQSL
jgi:hypothetical protein